MQWQEIRSHYPQQWLLVQAIQAHSEAGKRVLEQLAVISTFSDSVVAMKSYSQLHREAPQRELYVFHTSRETLDVTERKWIRRYSPSPDDARTRSVSGAPRSLRGEVEGLSSGEGVGGEVGLAVMI